MNASDRAPATRTLLNLLNATLTRSASLLFGAITLITASCAAYDYVLIAQEGAESVEQLRMVQNNSEKLLEITHLQQEVRFDIVQIQQFLSDYSATRGLDGQDDGLENAAKFAKKMSKDIAEAKALAIILNDRQLADSFSKITESFQDYQRKGVEMAKTYAAEGASAGNKLMPAFDKMSDALQEEIESTSKSVAALKQQFMTQTQESNKTIDALRDRSKTIAMTNVFVILIVCVAAVIATHRFAIQPLQWITFTFKELVHGSTNYDIDEARRPDEIGELGRTYTEFRKIALDRNEAAKRAEEQAALTEAERRKNETERAQVAASQEQIIEVLSGGLAKVAQHDLRSRIDALVPPAYEVLKQNFNSAIENLQEALEAVVKGVESVNSTTQEIGCAADDLARRTEQQAASLEETAAAVQEVYTGVKNNSEGAQRAREMVASAISQVEKSNHIAQNTIDAMTRIEKSSSDISQIIGVIDEIAFQTNLLALNAGVEAARAGEAGRGFAVVASEVRALAQRSAEAAKQIKQLISASAGEVADGVKFVSETRDALHRFVALMTEINRVVSQTATTALEQLNSIQQINVALQQMDQDTQKNAAMVEETTAATHGLRQEASGLALTVKAFNIGNASQGPAKAATNELQCPRPRNVQRKRADLQATVGATALKVVERNEEEDWTEF